MNIKGKDKKLEFSVRWKPTSLGVPLGTKSAHNYSTLVAWKRGEIRRVASISSSRQLFVDGIQQVMGRLNRYMEPIPILRSLSIYDAYTDLGARKPSSSLLTRLVSEHRQ